MKRLAIITGSRSEYGCLRPLLRLARESKAFELQLIVAGMHLSEQHGYTVREVEADGYAPIHRVGTYGLPGFPDAFAALRPDLVLVEGDRIEALTATIAAAYMGIPVAHSGGGCVTGTIDNAARHAISMFASLHFVETNDARDRLLRFGCDPAAIHVVGALGIDAIRLMEWRFRADTLADLGLPAGSRYLLVVFHPESEAVEQSGERMEACLRAAGECGDLVVVYPNSDPGSAAIIAEIERFRRAFRCTVKAYPSLSSDRYLHALRYADALVGNSSSGLLEAPTLRVPVVNVGMRQAGRAMAVNVLGCDYSYDAIMATLNTALHAPSWRALAATADSPFGDGHVAERMLAVIEGRLGE